MNINSFKSKIRNVGPVFKKDIRANTIMKKSILFGKRLVVIGDEGSFLLSLLCSVLIQYDCRVHMVSMQMSAKPPPSSIISPTAHTEMANDHPNQFEHSTINLQSCWNYHHPNQQNNNNNSNNQQSNNTTTTTTRTNQTEYSKALSEVSAVVKDTDFVLVCFEWSDYYEIYDKLDMIATAAKHVKSSNVIISFPLGVEEDATVHNQKKSIESLFEGIPASTFLFYSALMQWLFVGPPSYFGSIELTLENNNSNNTSNTNNNTSSGDDGCYWLDCDDLIKVIVELLLVKNSTSGKMHVLTGKEYLTCKEISNILYNDTQIIVNNYNYSTRLHQLTNNNQQQLPTTKQQLVELQSKFFEYLKSSISTVVSPDIELFLNQLPTTFSQFLVKCRDTQLFVNNSRSNSLGSSYSPPNSTSSTTTVIITSSSTTTTNGHSLSNSLGGSYSAPSTPSLSHSSNTNNNNTTAVASSNSSCTQSSGGSVSTPVSPETTGLSASLNSSTVAAASVSSRENSRDGNSVNGGSTTTNGNNVSSVAASITYSAYKFVSSPLTFLKYSKAFLEETIYKTPATNKKDTNTETNTWITLLTSGFKKMLDESSGELKDCLDQTITNDDYLIQSVYDVMDEYQSTWEFTSYSPKPFNSIRLFYKIQNYLKNIETNDIVEFQEVTTIGRSGSFFFKSKDDRYFIKTIPQNEFQTFTKILPSYYQHILKYPNNLLPRFFGLFRLKGKLHIQNATNSSESSKERDIVFIVMENLFYSSPLVELSEKYDLKGSTVGRYVDIDELDLTQVPTLKDLNLKRKIHIGPFKKLLLAQIEIDTDWMLSHYICDYSLLLGIHIIPKSTSSSSTISSASSTPNSPPKSQKKDISFFKKDNNGIQSSTNQKKPMHVIPIRNGKPTISPTLNTKDINQVQFKQQPQQQQQNGGVGIEMLSIHDTQQQQHLASSNDSVSSNGSQHHTEEEHNSDSDCEEIEGIIYFIGLIDTLTTYDMKKRGENAIKSVIFDKNQISAISPKDYRARFIKYAESIIE